MSCEKCKREDGCRCGGGESDGRSDTLLYFPDSKPYECGAEEIYELGEAAGGVASNIAYDLEEEDENPSVTCASVYALIMCAEKLLARFGEGDREKGLAMLRDKLAKRDSRRERSKKAFEAILDVISWDGE